MQSLIGVERCLGAGVGDMMLELVLYYERALFFRGPFRSGNVSAIELAVGHAHWSRAARLLRALACEECHSLLLPIIHCARRERGENVPFDAINLRDVTQSNTLQSFSSLMFSRQQSVS